MDLWLPRLSEFATVTMNLAVSCAIFLLSLFLMEGTTKDISKEKSNLSPAETAEILSSGFLRLSKRHKGHPLPPRVDLMFVLDSSDAVGEPSGFQLLLSFTNILVGEFSVSPSTTRVALVLCSAVPDLVIDLGQFVNREGTQRAVKDASFLGGEECALDKALQVTRRLVTRSHQDTRNKARTVVFIVTASPVYTRSAVIAKTLQNSGAEMFLLAIGPDATSHSQRIIPKNRIGSHFLVVGYLDDLPKAARYFRGKGFHLKCYGNKPVFDECRRRCRCSSSGELVYCYRVRQEFTSMSVQDRRRYVQTLKIISTLQPYKRFYDYITRFHPKLFDKVHVLEYFFPWHRWYILTFENFLRRIDCRVTVPYWDWSRAVSGHRLWRTSHYHDMWFPDHHGLGGNGVGKSRCVMNGPFREGAWEVSSWVKQKDKCLTRRFNDCFKNFLPNSRDVKYLLKIPIHQFKLFEDNVRSFMHNDFHNAIGGVMSLDESANAPEFWFHHGFLDKLWSDWQNRGTEFKYQYYDQVTSRLPGAGVHGTQFVDLSRQPNSVKVVYEQPNNSALTNDKFYPNVPRAKPVPVCDNDESDTAKSYRSRLRHADLEEIRGMENNP